MNRLFLLTLLSSLFFAPPVEAAEPVVCTITTAAAAVSTAAPTTGTCSWQAGSTVLVSCDQDIYIDSTTTGVTPPVASSADQKLVFTSNQDPVPVYLEPRDKVISVIWVSVAGTCKFMTVSTRRPR